MLQKENELSVIIPSYLEEENLRIIIPRLFKVLEKFNFSTEILIIDTLTQLDSTKELCDELKKNSKVTLKYINRENNNYFGSAIRTAIKYINSNYTIFMDADGSHSPEFIPKLLEYRNKYDVIIASRYVEGGDSDNKKILKIMSYIVNFTFSIILNLNCKDVSNSFKLYNTESLKNLYLKCNNFDIVEEILLKLKRQKPKLSIYETPYVFKERLFGHTKRNLFIFIFSYIFTLLKLRFTK